VDIPWSFRIISVFVLCPFRVRSVFVSVVELPRWPDGPLDLPQRAAAVVPERFERADLGERRQLVTACAGPGDERVKRRKTTVLGLIG
jgi:hypothetical protein